MVEIDKPRIECIDSPEDPAHGIFIVEPLERGYGTTLGNSLRRILLSSLPGTAATSIKIAGVQHEFSTIPGVKEDVTEIVLNIKRIIFKMNCDGVKTVYIDASGECEVTAGDIKTDDDVEILNKDLHICSLGPDAMLNMEITNGAAGITGIPQLTSWPLLFIVMVLSIMIVTNFGRSRQGRACISIREDEIASEAMGVNTTKYKTLAFVIGAMLASVAGALYACNFFVIQPDLFNFNKSIDILVMVVFGGMGSITAA